MADSRIERGFTPFESRGGVGTIESSSEFEHLTCRELEDKIAAEHARNGICSCLSFSEHEELSRMERELEERRRNGRC